RINEISRFKNNENKIYSRNKIMPPFVSVVNPNHNYPIGLFISGNESHDEFCTASQHNLSFLSFSPGYDNGTNGPLGVISIVDTAIPYTHLVDPNMTDYAPHGGRKTLQDYTGALGWRFDIGNGELTSLIGYPIDGDLENCANDAEHLCKWQGITEKLENYYDIRNIDFGLGASRGPFISQYNTTTNLGYAYAVYDGFFDRSS
ncbi:4525_t:CDS:2, partial [Gigaspora rosea]